MAQDNGNQDKGMEGVYVAIGIAMLLFVSWALFHEIVIKIYLSVWKYQAVLAGFFTDDFRNVPAWTEKVNPKTYGFFQFAEAASVMGKMTNKITAGALFCIAFFVYFKSPHETFKKRHSMKSLMAEGVKEWPQIAPVIGLDLLSEDKKRIMAMNKEYETAKKENRAPIYKPAQGFEPPMSEWFFSRAFKLVGDDAILNSTKAEVVMTKQLGKLYSGALTMRAHRRVIFALLALRMDRKNKEYIDLRGRVALSFNNKNYTLFNGHVSIEEIDKIVNKYKNHKLIKRIRLRHAYETTLLVSMLAQARVESGVLASADFIWLRPMDRVLWYALNGEGRRVGWPESAGVRAHWLAEMTTRSRIETPIIVEAVNALREALIANPEITFEE